MILAFKKTGKDNKNIPIFLLPGILGKGDELTNLATALAEQYPNHPIRIWRDDKWTQSSSDQKKSRLSEVIAQEILDKMPKGEDQPTSCLLIGYSYGGMDAAITASLLAKEGIKATVIALDSPSVTVTQKRLSDSTDRIHDLIDITTYFATMNALIGDPKKLTLPTATDLKDKVETATSLENEIQIVTEQLFEKNNITPDTNSKNYKNFQKCLSVVTDNLTTLQSANLPTNEDLTVVPFMLAQTCKKYKCKEDGGWENTSNKIIIEEKEVDHLSLLENNNIIQKITAEADKIISSIKAIKSTTPKKATETSSTGTPPFTPIGSPRSPNQEERVHYADMSSTLFKSATDKKMGTQVFQDNTAPMIQSSPSPTRPGASSS